jgi:RimJ/RimL family protein N-acetyltransferase
LPRTILEVDREPQLAFPVAEETTSHGKPDFQVAYRVETPRLVLRCWSPEDAPALRAALDKSDRHLRPFIPFMKDEPRSLQGTEDWLCGHRAAFDRGENFRFGVFTKDGQLVGENMLLRRVGPDALEIGYLTHLGFEGRGYATEASAALVKVAFEFYDAQRVEIHHAAANRASGRIPERLGFTLRETLRDHIEDTEGRLHDGVIWCLHAPEYPATPPARAEITAFDALGQPME